MKLDLREDKYGKTKGIKNVRKASDEVLRDTIATKSKSAEPARAELERRKRTDADDEKKDQETPVEEPAEKDAEKPAEKPEETPDEEPKDEPAEPESDSTDSEDDEPDDGTDEEDEEARKTTYDALEGKIEELEKKALKIEKGEESKIKRAILNFLDEPPAKMIGVNFDGFPEGTKSAITKLHDYFQAKAKKLMDKEGAKIDKQLESLKELAEKLYEGDNYSKIMDVMKKNGVNSPDDFAKLSDEDREKLLKEIDKVINVEDDDTPEDDKEETPKDDVDLDDIEYYEIDPEDDDDLEDDKKKDEKGVTAANENYYGVRGAIRAVQESTVPRKKYPSMRTILNRMYGEQ
tara:strand:- start:646 stop:1689 length:1044 start_codon:yes stop_codon:yes gene_type:complete